MIDLDLIHGEPVHGTGSLVITLDRDYPAQLWELIEDAVADRLAHMNLKGSIEDSVTGNITTIKKLEKGKL